MWLSNARSPYARAECAAPHRSGGMPGRPRPGWGQQMTAGGPHPTVGLLLYSPQAQIVVLCVFENREECVTDCEQPRCALPGPASWSCCEGRPRLASAWLEASKQYKVTHAIQLLTSPKAHCHRADSLTSSRRTASPPSQKQKTNILIFTVTRYFRIKELLVVQFHMSGIRSKRKKVFPFMAKGLDGSRRQPNTGARASM